MESSISKAIVVSRGDFLLSNKLVPNPDEILLPDPLSGKDEFVIGILDRYLKFLEILITNERIIDTTFSTYTEDEANQIGKADLEEYFHMQFDLKEPELRQRLLKELSEKDIFFAGLVKGVEFSPRKIVSDYLQISPKLQKLLHKTIKSTPLEFKGNAELVAHIALAEDIGIPLCITELAKLVSLPVELHKIEMEAIKEFESTEVNLRNGVIAFLIEKLNQGARNEVLQIRELGNRIIYPETPIAWQIIRDSSRLEDFLPIALQLREEYKNFRKATIKIEEELFSDELTLKRKGKLVQELNMMAAEIWKGQENATQKTAQDFSSLLDLALNQATNLSLGNFPKLLEFILGKPTEILLCKLHQRKIKVVMSSKKQFMASNQWVGKLSSIFSLSESKVRESLVNFAK